VGLLVSWSFGVCFLVRATPVLVAEIFLLFFRFSCCCCPYCGGCVVGACTSPEVWLGLMLCVVMFMLLV